MVEVKSCENIDDSLLKAAVIIAKTNGKWVFCKHRERDTYEIPGEPYFGNMRPKYSMADFKELDDYAYPLSYNGLKISASSVGTYEFKILATDKAGNGMWYYDKDGKKVEVTTSNIWDIEEIPYFTYTIDNQGMKVKNEESSSASDRTVTKVVDEEYSLSGITIVGGSNQKTDYALFKVDTSKYSKLTQSVLAGVT